jgi:hypothetical protein
MEDLRPKQATSTVQNGRSVSTYTDHLPRLVIGKKLKKSLMYVVIIAVTSAVLYYPYEIGNAIGYWSYNFWTGLTHRF